jgi:hypothetical protein
LRAVEQDRPDVAEKRRVFIRRQPALDPSRLVFIDETWATTNMARRHGRAARGLRLPAPVPYGHWKVTTLVAGLRCTGITAPYVFDGAINGARFRAYVEQMLAPTLQPGDIVLLDNLASHKVAGISEAIATAGAELLYLPPPACAGAGSTVPISTRSSRLSPSSRPPCARPPSAPATPCGTPSAAPLISTHHNSAATSLIKPVMQPDRKPL